MIFGERLHWFSYSDEIESNRVDLSSGQYNPEFFAQKRSLEDNKGMILMPEITSSDNIHERMIKKIPLPHELIFEISKYHMTTLL